MLREKPELLPEAERLRTYAKLCFAGEIAGQTESKSQAELMAEFPEFYDFFQKSVTTTTGAVPSVTSAELQAGATLILQGKSPSFVISNNPRLLPYSTSLLQLSKFVRQRIYPK